MPKPKAIPTAEELEAHLTGEAERLGVVGAAIGIRVGGEESYAVHGVTNAEHPLPVDPDTMFMIGSTGKLLTATTIMRLVEAGKLDLDARVREYLPDLKLQDEDAAENVTVLQLLNHTAGWDGDYFEDTGNGDDALERYAELMSGLTQVTPLGEVVSYNNSALSLAGRVIEVANGSTFEAAVREHVFGPLGLEHSSYSPNEIMTRRFAASHSVHDDDGEVVLLRPWGEARSGNPAGSNIVMSVRDLVAFGAFHNGDGAGVLSKDMLERMRTPTVELRNTSLHGDAVGVSFFLREVDGIRLAEHGGDSPGQHCEFQTAPDEDFVVAAFANSSPNGARLVSDLAKWALQAYLGIVEEEPTPMDLSRDELRPYEGVYETNAGSFRVQVDDDGVLRMAIEVKPELIEQFGELAEEMMQSLPPPMPLGITEGDGYVVTGGPQDGDRGAFVRGDEGFKGLHMGGRYAVKTG